MDWTGEQQLWLLLQSALVGAMIGCTFDAVSGWFRGRIYRRPLFWADVWLGVLAALVTFFGSLVIMDGLLHPMLFVGVFIGFLLEHYTIGKVIAFMMRWIHRFVMRFKGKIGSVLRHVCSWACRCFRKMCESCTSRAKNQ